MSCLVVEAERPADVGEVAYGELGVGELLEVSLLVHLAPAPPGGCGILPLSFLSSFGLGGVVVNLHLQADSVEGPSSY